jgi:sugar lactone lactonase YvrE
VTKWGAYGSEDGQFKYPYGVAVDGSGDVYVADFYNHRIQKFDSAGNFVTKWGTSGSGDGQFDYPFGIAVDGLGYVYVADTYNYRIQKFDSDGNFVTKWGTWGSDHGQFRSPYGIAVDGSGYVYVADSSNNRIQIFAKLNDRDGDGIEDDFDSCPDENSISFDANADGCIDRLNDLQQIMETLPSDVLAEKVRTGLTVKVNAALSAIYRGKVEAAINIINAAINSIEARKGKKISADAADMLIGFLDNVIAQLA